MPMITRLVYPDASDVYLDDSLLPFIATNVQEGFNQIVNLVSQSASPPFFWSRGGNIPTGSWLENGSVRSNVTGINFPYYQGELLQLSVSNEILSTCTIGLYEHDKVTYTLLAQIDLVNAYRNSENYISVLVSTDKELAVQVIAGSCRNVVVQASLRGSVVP